MTEWNGDPQWWQNGVQIKVVEPPVAPAPRAYTNSGAAQPATSHFAVVEVPPAMPASPPASKQDLKDSKKYKTDPPVKRQPWFEFLPLQTSVKPTLRPKKSCSQKNQVTVDKQAAREQQAADARTARYMQQAAELAAHNHHHKLQLGNPEEAQPDAHIVMGDMGRHRPEWARSDYLFDPITSTSRPVTAPGRTYSRAGLLSPYKGSILQGTLASSGDQQDTACDSTSSRRDSSSSGADSKGHETLFFAGSLYHTYKGEIISLTRSRPGTASGSPGRYNPLTHTWAEPPSDAAAYARWQRDGETATKTLSSRRPLSAGAGRDGCAAAKDTVGGLLRQSSSSRIGALEAERPASAGRRHVRAMDTWGTYDVLRNEWIVPPADARFVNAEMSPYARRAEPLQSTGKLKPMRKTITPPNQGVYDPIKAEWKVLPEHRRAAQSLDFAPRKLFEEKAFVKR